MTSASTSCCPWWPATENPPRPLHCNTFASLLLLRPVLFENLLLKFLFPDFQSQLFLPLIKWLQRFFFLNYSPICVQVRPQDSLRYSSEDRDIDHLFWSRVSHWPGAYQGLGWLAPQGTGMLWCSLPQLWGTSVHPHTQHFHMGFGD